MYQTKEKKDRKTQLCNSTWAKTTCQGMSRPCVSKQSERKKERNTERKITHSIPTPLWPKPPAREKAGPCTNTKMNGKKKERKKNTQHCNSTSAKTTFQGNSTPCVSAQGKKKGRKEHTAVRQHLGQNHLPGYEQAKCIKTK